MKALLPILFALSNLGVAGLFIVGILDSSFLFLPFGNDLMVLGMSAREPEKIAWFALWAALGSTTGSMLVDALARKGGEEGLSRFLPEKRAEYVKDKISRKAGFAIAIAALLPPPFPFTPFVAAAAALQYPRKSMIAVLLSARMLRFCIVGMLGAAFGSRIMKMAEQPAVQYALMGLLAVFVVGSVWSVYGWFKKARSGQSRNGGESAPAHA